MKRMLLIAGGVVALGVATVVLAWKGYLGGDVADNDGGGPLAPAQWATYVSDAWTVSYPGDWTATKREEDGAVSFAPQAEALRLTYFIVLEYDMTYTAALRVSEDDALKSTPVRIANYEATKLELGSGRHEYVIDYKDRVVVLATDMPDNDTVGIMMASFGFIQ